MRGITECTDYALELMRCYNHMRIDQCNKCKSKNLRLVYTFGSQQMKIGVYTYGEGYCAECLDCTEMWDLVWDGHRHYCGVWSP